MQLIPGFRLAALSSVLGALLIGPTMQTDGRGKVNTARLDARERLACNGTTDDHTTFAGLVAAGGEWAGRTVDFDQCTMFWSSCTTGSGDCTVATIAPGTQLLGRKDGQPTIKLAARVCVGGDTPGASCYENGSSDCNGGTCTYEDGARAFAHTGAATYTLLKTPASSACSSAGTPWPCCTGSGTGICANQPQGIAILDFKIAVRQVEDYGRCSNGSTEQGKACRGYCLGGALDNFSCSEASDCPTGTCVNSALCPGANSDCDLASQSPSGTGSIVLVDASGSAGVTVERMVATDHLKGKGILAGRGARVVDNDLTAMSGFTGLQPASTFFTPFYPSLVSYAVTVGIQTEASSVVDGNRVRATSLGIDVGSTTFGGQFASVYAATASTSGNTITVSGDGVIGLRNAAAGSAIRDNSVTGTAGDYTFGIRSSGNGSTVEGNVVTLGPDTDTDGVGVEVTGTGTLGGGNSITVAHDTRGTGLRLGQTACTDWPACVGGAYAKFSGDVVNIGDNGVGVELFGHEAGISSTTILAGADSQSVAVGQNGQQVVDGITAMSGAVGVGPNNRKFCTGGANDGKICRQDTTSAATCTGGTCTFDDWQSNYTVSNSRIAFQTGTGIFLPTGGLAPGNYVAWQTGRGVVLGDDRVNVGLISGHSTITGGLIHAFANNVPLVTFPDVGNGLCSASLTPWKCCTGNGTGTCSGTMKLATITGVLLIGTNTGVTAIDFSTSFDSSSPDISGITISGNGCYPSGSGAACVRFPAANQNKISDVTISGNGKPASSIEYVSNWSPAMGTRDDEFTACTTKGTLVAADDDWPIFMPFFPVTVVGFGCNCQGTCGGTMATLTLEDGGGNAMTVTGTNPTCATTGNATFAAVTAGNSLQAGETVAFDVTNTPQTGNNYIVCVRYTKP